jgi:hypothetical protein
MVERITAAAERESDNTESTQRNRTQHNGSPEPANEEAA